MPRRRACTGQREAQSSGEELGETQSSWTCLVVASQPSLVHSRLSANKCVRSGRGSSFTQVGVSTLPASKTVFLEYQPGPRAFLTCA